jgi:hypothetical protein
LTPGSRIRIRDEEKSGSGINITNHISESLVTKFDVTKLNFLLIQWCRSEMDKSRSKIRDGQNSRWKNSDPEPEINIPDPQHWSQILLGRVQYRYCHINQNATVSLQQPYEPQHPPQQQNAN